MRYLFVPLMLVIIVTSGCTYLEDFFGQDVIQVEETTLEEGVSNILVISDVTTIPKSPLLPGRDVILSFIIENKDEREKAENVVAELFDAPMFRDSTDGITGELCNENTKPCKADRCGIDDPCEEILPSEQKMISFDLVAPDESDIANLAAEIDLHFRVSYTFTSSLLYNSFIVSMDEIKARQRAGEAVNLEVTKTPGSGPVQIDVELLGAPYILSDFSGTFLFTIKKVSSLGVLKNSKIPVGKWKIEFPADIGTIKSTKFKCEEDGAVVVCTNNEVIELYSGESPTYRLELTDVPDIDNLGIPYKSFNIRSEVEYEYEVRDSLKVKVKPYD
jgi:hypothetical protein